MSAFDPDSFLSQSVEGQNDTKLVPCPAGEYMAVVDSVSARQWQSKEDPTRSGVTLEVLWSIDDEGVRQFLDRKDVKVKQGVMLDLLPDGKLDMGKGKNVGLGRLREAIGLNRPDQPFGFSMLTGQLAKVNVSHRADPKDPEVIYAEIRAVAKAG